MANIDDKSVKLDKSSETVTIGNVYVAKKDTRRAGREVTPHFLDFARNTVHFTTVGRGDEDRMPQDEFLDTFEDTGSNRSPTRSEKLNKKDA